MYSNAIETNSISLPSYGNPPIAEVVCSVVFSKKDLLSPHIGLLWQRFQPKYPQFQDLPPLAPAIEFFNNQDLTPMEMEFTSIPPLPRTWFIGEDGSRVVQIQKDRLIHNWRRVSINSEYPRYVEIIQGFQECLNTFELFLLDQGLGTIQFRQYELTYLNQIPQGCGWSSIAEISKVFPDINWNSSSSRFLSDPKSISWSSVFEIPNQVGRLHVSISPIVVNDEISLSFELTVRGIKGYESRNQLENWFDIAHNWIVRSFSDLTSESVQQEVWDKKEVKL
jgi:uncharacterized protein (TIGR04255 family)